MQQQHRYASSTTISLWHTFTSTKANARVNVMLTNYITGTCISFIINGFKTVVLLFIAIDTSSTTPLERPAFSNGEIQNIERSKNLDFGEIIRYSNYLNSSVIGGEAFLQLNSNETDAINLTKHGPYLALSAFNGHLDPAFIELINPFWLKFNPPSAKAHYILGCIHACIMMFGLFGNALVIFMFIRCRSIRTPCNTLVINLAISDFFMLAKAPIVIYNSFKLGPALGDNVCRIYGFIGGLTGTASIATLTAISIDRYNVVVYPLDPLRTTTRQRCYLMVFIVWIYSFTFSIVPALNIGFSKYVPEGYLTSCSFDYLDKTVNARIFMLLFFIFAWFIPFTIITYCYIYILKVVISSRKIRSSKDQNKTEIKLSIIVIGVILLWFAAWTPYSIVALLGISGNEDKITPFGSMIPAVFCKASACVDPYVYAITHPRFRMEFGRLFLGRDKFCKLKTSYSKCNIVNNPSITRKHVVSDANDVNRIMLENMLKNINSFSDDDFGCERNSSNKLNDFETNIDTTDVVAVVESLPQELKVV